MSVSQYSVKCCSFKVIAIFIKVLWYKRLGKENTRKGQVWVVCYRVGVEERKQSLRLALGVSIVPLFREMIYMPVTIK